MGLAEEYGALSSLARLALELILWMQDKNESSTRRCETTRQIARGRS